MTIKKLIRMLKEAKKVFNLSDRELEKVKKDICRKFKIKRRGGEI